MTEAASDGIRKARGVRHLFELNPIGLVRSPLHRREDAPRQASDSAPEAWLEIYPQFAQALEGNLVALRYLPDSGQDHGGNQGPAVSLKDFNDRQQPWR